MHPPKNPGMTGREISALLSAGKVEDGFNAIVDSYPERLYWHIRHFSLSHEDADELHDEEIVEYLIESCASLEEINELEQDQL